MGRVMGDVGELCSIAQSPLVSKGEETTAKQVNVAGQGRKCMKNCSPDNIAGCTRPRRQAGGTGQDVVTFSRNTGGSRRSASSGEAVQHGAGQGP